MNGQPRWWQTLLAFVVVAAIAGVGLAMVLRSGSSPRTPHGSPSTAASPGSGAASTPPSGASGASPGPPPQQGARGQVRREVERYLQREARKHRRPRATTFTVSSLNLLGFSHTAPGGNRRGWAGGRQRMAGAVAKLRQHHVDVAGLQEFQVPQFRVLRRLAPEYAVFPGVSGPSRTGVQNSIIWRTSRWQLLQRGTVPIPYFHGRRVRMPYVLLRNRHSDRRIWFANFHNPANVHGPAQRFRDRATALEATLFRRLLRSAPLVVTGDMNERAGYPCRLLPRVPLHSPNGARRGHCGPQGRAYVDWILASPQVEFPRGLLVDRSVQGRLTDHPMMVARVVVPAH